MAKIKKTITPSTKKSTANSMSIVSWKQSMQRLNEEDNYIRSMGADPNTLTASQRASFLNTAKPISITPTSINAATKPAVKKTIKKKNPYTEVDSDNADFFRNVVVPGAAGLLNPIVAMSTGLPDIPSNITQMAAKMFNKDARMSNSSLTDDQKVILWNVIKNAQKRSGKISGGGTEYQDYGGLGYGSSEEFNDWFNRGKINTLSGLYNSNTNPGFELASTIGRGRYWADEQDPNKMYYTDVYDWNPSERNFSGKNPYQVVRNAVRAGENTNMNKETNDPYRMNFQLTKDEVDAILARKKAEEENDDSFLGLFKNGGWLNKYQKGGTTHIVGEGDNLWKIANDYGLSLNQLIAANPQIENPDRILLNQKINIPTSSKTILPKQTYSPTNTESIVYKKQEVTPESLFNPSSFKAKNNVLLSKKDNHVEAYVPPRPVVSMPGSESNQGTAVQTKVRLQNEIIAKQEQKENQLMNQYGYDRQQAREIIARGNQPVSSGTIDYVDSDPRSQSYVGNPATSLLVNPNQVQGYGARVMEAGNYLPIDIAGATALSVIPGVNTAMLASSIPSMYKGFTEGVPTTYNAWKKYINGPSSDWTVPVYETSKTILDIAPSVDLAGKVSSTIPSIENLEKMYVKGFAHSPTAWDAYSTYKELKRNPLGLFTRDVKAPTVEYLQQQREIAQAFDSQKKVIMNDVRTMANSSVNYWQRGATAEEKLNRLKEIERKMHSYSDETVYRATGLSKQEVVKRMNRLEKKLNLNVSKVDYADDPSKIIDINQYNVPFKEDLNNRQLVYGADKIDQSDFMTPEELFFYKTANENRQQIPYMATGAQKNASPLSLIREAKTAFANAPSNSKFLAATSLSADSKPIELRELLSQLQSGAVKKIKFEGMKNLNDMSHLYAADVPKSIMVDDLNSMIDQINIYLPNSKKLKRAVLLSDGEIYAPQIVITKK